MALQYIRFTELDAVSSAAVGDIIPLVESVTNLNKKTSLSGNMGYRLKDATTVQNMGHLIAAFNS